MWIMNLGKPVNIPSLNEAMAIELGANLLGEGIIFGVAAGLLFIEYSRQTRKETAKETARKEEMETLQYTIQELYFTTERQDAQIRELTHIVLDLECEVNHKSWLGRKRHPKHAHHPSNDEEMHYVPNRHHHTTGKDNTTTNTGKDSTTTNTGKDSTTTNTGKDPRNETNFVMRAVATLYADMEGHR